VCTQCTQCTRPNSRVPKHQPAHIVLKTICSNISLALLKMGIMIPEICWANGLLKKKKHNLFHLVGLTRHFILRMQGDTNIKIDKFQFVFQV